MFFSKTHLRINRNILECKDALSTRNQKRVQRINRNILECKEHFIGSNASLNSVLIETYWNVKSGDFTVSFPLFWY